MSQFITQNMFWIAVILYVICIGIVLFGHFTKNEKITEKATILLIIPSVFFLIIGLYTVFQVTTSFF